MNNATPRTDAEIIDLSACSLPSGASMASHKTVPANLCRKIERELSQSLFDHNETRTKLAEQYQRMDVEVRGSMARIEGLESEIEELEDDNLSKDKLIAKLQKQLTKALEGIAPSEFPASHTTFKLGQLVRKKRGSQWSGKVCGFYSTELNPEGYNVESSSEIGSVQLYPSNALESLTNPK